MPTLFVATGLFITNTITRAYSSPDGIVWTLAPDLWTVDPTGDLVGIRSVVSNDGALWVAAGGQSSDRPCLMVSSLDGLAWTLNNTQPGIAGARGINCIAFGGGQWIAGDLAGNIITSPDGLVWAFQASVIGAVTRWNGVAFGAGMWVLVNKDGTIASSPDGLIWTNRGTPVGAGVAFNGVTFANGIFLASADLGVFAESVDGINWSTVDTLSGNSLEQSAFGNAEWVVGSPQNGLLVNIFRSSDALAWTSANTYNPSPPNPETLVTGMVFAASVFVGVGASAVLPTSIPFLGWSLDNGVTWTVIDPTAGLVDGSMVGVGTIPAAPVVAGPNLGGSGGGGGMGGGVGGAAGAMGGVGAAGALASGIPVTGCGCCPTLKSPFHRRKRKTEFDCPPPASKHVDVRGTQVGPATVVPVVLCQYQVPNNCRFQLHGLVAIAEAIANWTPGDGNVIFSLLIYRALEAQGVPYKDFQAVTIPLGSYRMPWEIPPTDRMVLESRSILRLLVQTDPLAITPGTATRFNGVLQGYEWAV